MTAPLLVPRLPSSAPGEAGLRAALLERGALLGIGTDNWPTNGTGAVVAGGRGLPRADLRLGHDGKSLLLLFSVEEDGVRAANGTDQDPVWQDSCVELFATLLDDRGVPRDPAGYYNFEFNAVGALLSYFGPDRENREAQPASALASVERTPSLGRTPFGFRPGIAAWDLLVRIPAAAFSRHAIADFGGRAFAANAYKCGDELPRPHYLSWAPIASARPDFHRPEAFLPLVCEA